MKNPFPYIALLLICIFNNAFARDIIHITASKSENQYQEMPIGILNSHEPDTISFNKTYLENKPTSLNAFSAIDGISSVEYQKNLQDSGGHTGVSINQLPFYYTSIFVDGIYIPESSLDSSQFLSSGGIQSLKVNKGAASSGANPSSVAGSIAVQTLDVERDSVSLTGTLGNYNNYNTGLIATRKVNKNSGFMLQISTNGQNAIDGNHDGIAESPKLRNNFATLSHQFKNDDIKIKTRIDFSQNQRQGGAMVDDKSNATGNPFNFLNAGGTTTDSYKLPDGTVQTWNKGTAGLLEEIKNTRLGLLSSAETKKYIFGGLVSILKRDNFYSGNKYKADEGNVFVTGARKFNVKRIDFKIGGDFQHQNFSSEVTTGSSSLNNPDGYSYSIASYFANANYSAKKFDVNLSNRISAHNQFGILPVFRGRANYHHTQNIVSTISAGNSFITPSSSFEQNHELITSELKTLERSITKPTESLNLAYNTTFTYEKFHLNLNYNYNKISNIAALELDESGANLYAKFKTLKGFYQNQGVGFDATFIVSPTFFITLAGEKYWNNLSHLEEGYLMLSRPEYKVSAKITKRHKNNVVNVGGTFYGRNDLQAFYGELYNLSGEKIARFSPNYFIMDFGFTRELTKKHKIFAGVDNIFDYLQVRSSTQVAIAKHGNKYHFDNINSWGPVRGRFFYVGVRVEM